MKKSVVTRLKDAITPRTLPALLDQHDALSARLDDLHRQHAAESQALRQAQTDLRTASDAAFKATDAARNRYCYGVEDAAECELRIATVTKVQDARLALRRAQSRVDEIESRLKATDDAITAADQERFALKDAPESATLDELIDLQARLAAARDEVASLTQRLDTLSAVPVEPLPDLTATDAALADALVKVDLGEADADILPRLELERASARQARTEAQAEHDRADLLRQGLTARLAAATAEAERLEAGHKKALAWHLEAEINRIAADYRQAAERLFELRARLIGLSRVLQYRVDHDAGQRIGVERPTYDSPMGEVLTVPDASLPALQGMSDALQDTRRFRDAAAEAELNRLRQTGIEV